MSWLMETFNSVLGVLHSVKRKLQYTTRSVVTHPFVLFFSSVLSFHSLSTSAFIFFPIFPLVNPFPIVSSVRMAMQSNLFSYLSLYSPSSIPLSLFILQLSFCLSPFPVIFLIHVFFLLFSIVSWCFPSQSSPVTVLFFSSHMSYL